MNFEFLTDISEIDNFFYFFKKIVLIFSLFLFLAFIFFSLKISFWEKILLRDLYEFFSFKSYEKKKGKERWLKILKRLESGIEAEYKLAFLEGREFLEKILKEMGLESENFEEKIKKLGIEAVVNREEVKNLQQVYSNIINDPSFHFSLEKAKETLKIYEKILQEIDAI